MFFGRKDDTSEGTDAASDAASEPDDDTEATVFGSSSLWVALMLLAIALMGAGAGVWFRKRELRR